ncbi:SDR family oxidoreductase [Oceaniglobus roseus]|uniref:SDR family oxidoreductase n=1 Tax=Oceaniglobus roseus TaxID=1737570 RepID=UPI000C7EEF32|nr:SDR family oxidoreductase [Kandeliimicrobium roseum]
MTDTAKTIVITGASRGIGRATALLCGARGWNVAVNYRADAAAAERTADEVRAAGGQSIAVQGDATDEAATLALFDAAEAAFGRIDGVVVNAGIVAPGMALAEMTLERMRRVVETNVIGALLCAREAARRLPRPMGEPAASLVFVSSVAARLGSAGEYVDYAASKGAIDTLTAGLAVELAPQNIRVNAVRPGVIETEIHASGGQPDRAARVAQMVPMKRPGRAPEVAEALAWLLSEAASYTSGAILDVSGGR